MPHERLPEIPINSIADFKKHILGEEGMEAKSWQQAVVHADGCTTNLGVIGATCNCGAERQAEISFKRGEDQGYSNGRISGYNEATQKAIKTHAEGLEAGHKAGKAEAKKELIKAGWKSPEEWQTEYLLLERKAHSTGRREVIEWGDELCPHGTLAADTSKAYKRECDKCWQALQHLEKGEER